MNWLFEHADEIGRAKSEAVRCAHRVTVVEAIEFKKADGAMDLRKMTARASDAYRKAVVQDAVAAGEYERLRALRYACEMRIEAWRTEQANFRSMKL